MLQYINHCRL